MKNENVDYAAKVALGPVYPASVTDSSIENEKSTRVDSYEKSTESVSEEFPEICALLKVDLFEYVNACTKFVNNVVKVFPSDSFTERHAYSRMSSLLTTMQNTLILVVESMLVYQDVVKATKEVKAMLTAQLSSTTEKIDKLKSELVVLKRSDVYAPTIVQLETIHQEVGSLKAKLSTIGAMLKAAEKEVDWFAPMFQNFECVDSEL